MLPQFLLPSLPSHNGKKTLLLGYLWFQYKGREKIVQKKNGLGELPAPGMGTRLVDFAKAQRRPGDYVPELSKTQNLSKPPVSLL